jgi:hypothetical protein
MPAARWPVPSQWWGRVPRPSGRRTRQPAGRALFVRPCLEQLEDRTLLSVQAVGPGPGSVTTGNFSGNGLSDVAVANQGNGTVSVLMSNGDGTFQPQQTYAAGPVPESVVTGHFTSSGNLDLAVANGPADTVSVLPGNGDGTFGAPIASAAGPAPQAIVAGDFLNNGRDDLVVQDSDGVRLLVSNGDGTFQAPTLIASTTPPFAATGTLEAPTQSLAVGYFTPDHNLDLVVTQSSGVSVYLGDGHGNFQLSQTLDGGFNPSGCTVGDFNGDGEQDIEVTGQNGISILYGNGDGTFQSPQRFNNNLGSHGLLGQATGNFMQDGHDDVANGVDLFAAARVWSGPGEISSTPAVAPGLYPVGTLPLALAAGDFTGNGRDGVAVVNAFDNTVSILLFSQTAQFAVTPAAGVTAGTPFSLTVTAQDVQGNTVPGYTGTVHFSSSDPHATLPTNYTFTPADHGVHTFTGLILDQAGSPTITVSDPIAGTIFGQSPVPVAPAGPDHLGVTAVATAPGTFNVTVEALDAHDNVAPAYTGTVELSSSDPAASLPADHTFTAADAGKYTFTGVQLPTLGQQTLTVTDLGTGPVPAPASSPVLVEGTAVRLGVTASTYRSADQPFSVTVTALDALGNPDPFYTGTIHFIGNSPSDGLPANYTFTSADHGRHTFTGLSLASGGLQPVRVADTGNSTVSGSQPIQIIGNSSATAYPVSWNGQNTAVLPGYLASGVGSNYFAVTLAAGDTITATADTSQPASGLDPFLQVIGPDGHLLASNDDYTGLDPRLTFQAATAGTYFVAVSASPAAVSQGAETGLYTLDLWRRSASLQPNPVVASLQVNGSASWGSSVTASYLIENRGGADAGPFNVSVVLSPDNRFDSSNVVLTTFSVSGLAAGASTSGTVKVTLPASPPAGFAALGPAYLGLGIGPSGEPISPQVGNDWVPLNLLTLQPASAGNTSLATADLLTLGTGATGTLTAGAANFFRVTPTADGLLKAQVDSGGAAVQLALYDALGNLLIQSSGPSSDGTVPSIEQHLTGTTSGTDYYLAVSSPGGTAYTLTTAFQASFPPSALIPTGTSPAGIATADFNGDGIPDLAVVNSGSHDVSILLGVGDGTFTAGPVIPVGQDPMAIVAGDFTGDGRIDLAVSDDATNSVTLLVGRGDGTFTVGPSFAVGSAPESMVAGDFNGDGVLDLATANKDSNDVSVLLGLPGGGFQPQRRYSVGARPLDIVAGDFTGDGTVSLATADFAGDAVSILRSDPGGSGTFTAGPQIAMHGSFPNALVAGDFSGTGHEDLAVVGSLSANVVILQGGPGGSLTPTTAPLLAPSILGNFMVAGDWNGDGIPDFAIANNYARTVAVYLDNGDGTFQRQAGAYPGGQPTGLVAADFNGDGTPDLATANTGAGFGPDGVNILLGGQDGSPFGPGVRQVPLAGVGQDYGPGFSVAAFDAAVQTAAADLTNNGIPDLIVPDLNGNDVAVLLGQGDGTFHLADRFATGGLTPIAVVAGDFNGDGRPDVAVANYLSNTVSIFLGLGDGTFRSDGTYQVGSGPAALTTFTQGGTVYLAVVNHNSGTVSLLRGQGDGTFQPDGTYGVGSSPLSIQAADLASNGIFDLVVANADSNDVSVLYGNGDGTFQPQVRLPVGGAPVTVLVGDFNGDGAKDLATINQASGGVSVLYGNGDGTFQPVQRCPVGQSIFGGVAGDFTGTSQDVRDLALLTLGGNVLVLHGQASGGFVQEGSFAEGIFGTHAVAADFDGDGHTDLALLPVAGASDGTVLLGLGNGQFTSPGTSSGIPATPLAANFTGNNVLDTVVLRQDGRILFRSGIDGSTPSFAPPLIVNPEPTSASAPDFFANDLAIVHDAGQPSELAALGTILGPGITPENVVRLYSFDRSTGQWNVTGQLEVPSALPSRIYAQDLNGDGLEDLIVTDANSGQVFVWMQKADGSFPATPTTTLATGGSASAVAFGSGPHPDLFVADPFSGTVDVFANGPAGLSTTAQPFAAGNGLYGLGSLTPGAATVAQSALGTTGLVAISFPGSSATNLVALDEGAGRPFLLRSDGNGGFFAPSPAFASITGGTVAVVGSFTSGPNPDLAVLDPASDKIDLYAVDASGQFTLLSKTDAGSAPTGLSVATINKQTYLLVGNSFGDVLLLKSDGTGALSPVNPPPLTGGNVPFVVYGNGNIVLTDQSQNQALSLVRLPGTTAFTRGGFSTTAGLMAPGFVTQADLNGDGQQDLIVANSGGNDVLVYLGTGPGQFQATPLSFAVGTDPVSITVEDFNGVPGLAVANQGSNDVSILLGQDYGTNTWKLATGPRLKAGAGPNNVAFRSVPGSAPEMVVTNGQDGTVSILPGIGSNGVGTGFFQDNNARTMSLASSSPGGSSGSSHIVQTILSASPGSPGLFLNAAGQVFSFNPDLPGQAPVLVFTPPTGSTVTALTTATLNASPSVVAGLTNNSLVILSASPGGSFTAAQTITDPQVQDPSAMQVVNVDGQEELYVTNAWKQNPVVVLLTGENESTDGQAFSTTAGGGVPVVTIETPGEVSLPAGTSLEGAGEINNPLFTGSAAGGPLAGSGGFASTTELEPLSNSPLALVGTVSAGSALASTSAEGADPRTVFVAGLGSLALSPATLALLSGDPENEQTPAGGNPRPGDEPPADGELNDFLNGTDNAIERNNPQAEQPPGPAAAMPSEKDSPAAERTSLPSEKADAVWLTPLSEESLWADGFAPVALQGREVLPADVEPLPTAVSPLPSFAVDRDLGPQVATSQSAPKGDVAAPVPEAAEGSDVPADAPRIDPTAASWGAVLAAAGFCTCWWFDRPSEEDRRRQRAHRPVG